MISGDQKPLKKTGRNLKSLMSRKQKQTMKKILTKSIFIFTLFLGSNVAYSQDVITKKTSEDIQAKVIEVNTTEIKYKKFDNQNGPTFTILKTDVLMIRYENGSKDIFNETTPVKTTQVETENYFLKGQKDAAIYYNGHKGAGTVTLVTSLLLTPLVGLIPALACSLTPPQTQNLNYPNEKLFSNSDYQNGYIQKAKKIKTNKVWTNWGIALGINTILILTL